ncbi:MoxR family ATPase, partial [Candidatus Woesearchaeota archaeon]|nr:MoxR family ATPase [Candidatus Woesearchaeota archaeon]
YLTKLERELQRVVIGQSNAVKVVIMALMCNGHVLLEGKPGLAKTLLVKVLAELNDCNFSRIQFTPDLLPTDIIGMTTLASTFSAIVGGKAPLDLEIIKGPVFANFILADEINRASPKVQSALLEAMQEKQVTIGKKTYKLDEPFLIFATQNPIEESGTYELPAAQTDRFLFKSKVGYPDIFSEEIILDNNVTTNKFSDLNIKPVINSKKIIEIQELVKQIEVSPTVKRYIVKIVDATRNPKNYNVNSGKYILYGASPRASIGLYIAGKANAFLNNKSFVLPQYIKNVAYDILRHRIRVNYEGIANKITSEDIIKEILEKVPLP